MARQMQNLALTVSDGDTNHLPLYDSKACHQQKQPKPKSCKSSLSHDAIELPMNCLSRQGFFRNWDRMEQYCETLLDDGV